MDLKLEKLLNYIIRGKTCGEAARLVLGFEEEYDFDEYSMNYMKDKNDAIDLLLTMYWKDIKKILSS
jgi:hypothetical protein